MLLAIQILSYILGSSHLFCVYDSCGRACGVEHNVVCLKRHEKHRVRREMAWCEKASTTESVGSACDRVDSVCNSANRRQCKLEQVVQRVQRVQAVQIVQLVPRSRHRRPARAVTVLLQCCESSVAVLLQCCNSVVTVL
jgi:hypothetical protein